MPNTPVLNLPYPAPSDNADVPQDMQALALALDGNPSMAPIGAIWLWPLAAAPAGYLTCVGQLVPAVDYPKLAALLGQVGGNVAIPDMRDKVPVGASAAKPLGSTGGEETVTLSTDKLPAHQHAPGTLQVVNHAHGGGTGGQSAAHNHTTFFTLVGSGGGSNIALGAPPPAMHGVVSSGESGGHVHAINGESPMVGGGLTANTGGGGAHNNLPPYLSLNYIIRAG